MGLELNRKNVRIILLIITFAVVVSALVQNLGVIYLAFRSIWNVLGVVIAGLGVAFVLNVPLRAFERRAFRSMRQGDNPALRKLVRPLSLVCSVVLAFGIIAIMLIVVIPQLSKTISDLAVKLPDYIIAAVNWAITTLSSWGVDTSSLTGLTLDWANTLEKMSGLLANGVGGFIGTAGSVGASVVSGVVDAAFCIVIALYVLAKKESIGAFVKRMMTNFLPEKFSARCLRLASMADRVFSSFISGQLTDSFILGILCYIGMRIFRFPYPEVISLVIGVTSLVPLVGSFIGEMVGAFLILFLSPLKALLFILFILALQQVDNSFIYPRIVGDSVGLPGVIVLCAVVVGGNVFGVLGALLSVPVCAVLYALLRESMDNQERRRATGEAFSAWPPEK